MEALEEDADYVDYIEYLEKQEEDAWDYYLTLAAYVEKLSKRKARKDVLEEARLDARKALGSHDKLVSAIGLAHKRHWDYLVEAGV